MTCNHCLHYPVTTRRFLQTVGTDTAYAPFESQNEKSEIVGFDIDVVRAEATNAGIEVKFENTPWDGIFNALSQGGRDLPVSAVTITDERKQTMDFSTPYFDARQLIAVKETSKVAQFDDLKKLKVGVQTGATRDEAVVAGIKADGASGRIGPCSMGMTHPPALVNEGVTLIKDSSLVSATGLAELALAARTVAGAHSRYWEPYPLISAVYLVLTLSLFAKRLEAPLHQRGK